MSDAASPYIGRSLRRREDRRLLTGQGQFIADLVLPRRLHAVLVRSPLAHARIRGVDLSRARTAPGIATALNGADLLQLLPPVPEGQISVPRKWATAIQHKFLNPQQPLLAHDKVRHVGEAIAIIAAETRNQAEDAAELVSWDLEELPAVVDAAAASAPTMRAPTRRRSGPRPRSCIGCGARPPRCSACRRRGCAASRSMSAAALAARVTSIPRIC